MRNRPTISPRQASILAQVKVNAPLVMLREGLLEKFLAWRINPELLLDAEVLDNISRNELGAMAQRIKADGLKTTVHGPFLDLSPGALDREVLEVTRRRFNQALDLAALFSPEHIVFHANYDWQRHQAYRERWLEVSLATWRSLVVRAKAMGFRLVLENVYEQTPEEMEPLLRELAGEGAGFCFDPGHASVYGRATVRQWLEGLAGHIQALHLHDNHGRNDDHLGLGQGRIDFKGLFEFLTRNGLRPPVITLEPHQEDHLWSSLVVLEELWPWPIRT